VDSTDEDPAIIRQTVANRVLFAGEATDYKYQGALQAAYLSGLKAAAEIVG
jgi:monoamine oxidase